MEAESGHWSTRYAAREGRPLQRTQLRDKGRDEEENSTSLTRPPQRLQGCLSGTSRSCYDWTLRELIEGEDVVPVVTGAAVPS